MRVVLLYDTSTACQYRNIRRFVLFHGRVLGICAPSPCGGVGCKITWYVSVQRRLTLEQRLPEALPGSALYVAVSVLVVVSCSAYGVCLAKAEHPLPQPTHITQSTDTEYSYVTRITFETSWILDTGVLGQTRNVCNGFDYSGRLTSLTRAEELGHKAIP